MSQPQSFMGKVFVDANIFIALQNKSDNLHKKAIALWKQAKENNWRLITTNLVINEVLTVLSLRVSKSLAIEFGKTIFEKTKMKIIYSSAQLEKRAFENFFASRKSKNLSFTDCVNLEVVTSMQIKKVFSFDKDYQIKNASFKIINT